MKGPIFHQAEVEFENGGRAIVWVSGLRVGDKTANGARVVTLYSDVSLVRCQYGRLHARDVLKCYCEAR